MTEKKLRNLMNQADFSQTTDLKERLRAQLFGSPVKQFPARRALEDDELDEVYAAAASRQTITDPEDLPNNRRK